MKLPILTTVLSLMLLSPPVSANFMKGFFAMSWSDAVSSSSSTSNNPPANNSSNSSSSSSSSAKSSTSSSAVSRTSTATTSSATPAPTNSGPMKLSAPYFALYSTVGGALPDPKTLPAKTNIFILTFWGDSGVTAGAQSWAAMSQADQISTKQSYNAVGIALMVSAFGSAETPTASNVDPATSANNLATWVKANNLDGVDIDYEDFDSMSNGNSQAWLITFQKTLSSALPGYIISHAPIGPWFSTNGRYPSNGYLGIDKAVGSSITFYNLQYYNQDQYYTGCADLITKASYWTGTSILELVAAGIPSNKLVMGKPSGTAQAVSGGFVAAADLAPCVQQGQAAGWNGGLMVWAWDQVSSDWFSTIWGK